MLNSHSFTISIRFNRRHGNLKSMDTILAGCGTLDVEPRAAEVIADEFEDIFFILDYHGGHFIHGVDSTAYFGVFSAILVRGKQDRGKMPCMPRAGCQFNYALERPAKRQRDSLPRIFLERDHIIAFNSDSLIKQILRLDF